MVILTLNCGSSSAKYQVYDWDNKEVMANGVVERIGHYLLCLKVRYRHWNEYIVMLFRILQT